MVTAKQVINSIKPKKIYRSHATPLGEVGYDNPRDDIERVKKMREGSVEKVPVLNNDIVNKKYVDDSKIWSLNGTHVYYNGGQVGIGTDTPDTSTTLHLKNTGTNIFKIESTAGQTQFNLKNSADEWAVYMSNGGTALNFWNGSDHLTISATGDVDLFNGTLDMNTHKITNVVDPTSDQEAATKKYVDDNAGGDLVDDTTPQLGGDLDLNGHALDFPTTANITDVLDEDDMASDSATKLATQQSIKAYVDTALGADVTVLKATFDITSNTSVIAAAGAGVKNKVVAISIHNNDVDGGDDTVVKVTDGNGGTNLLGGATGSIYLTGRGGFFGLPMSAAHPWCETTANTALYINPVSSKRIAGAVWYIQEA